MIRIIHRCMSKSDLSEKRWDNHLALFHLYEFRNSKEVYLNGKPLKWYNIFKNGDIVEVIDKPKGLELFFMIGASIMASSTMFLSAGITTAIGVLAVAGIVGAVGLGISALTGAFSSGNRGGSTTKNKEYSSQSQPQLTGANNEISNDIVPILFGKTQQTPSYAQTPYRLVQDGSSTNKYRQYFIANYNDVAYSNFKLGETSLNDYSADYVALSISRGGDTFIGFENVKAINMDEELSYNAKETVNQTATYYYNQNVTTTNTTTYNFSLKFENVDINHFANKTFKVTVNAKNGSNDVVLTNNFTIRTADITQEGNYYIYNGSYTWSNTVNYLTSTVIGATVETRGNSYEVTNGLNVILTSETITMGGYTHTVDTQRSLNYYNGTVSEVINTSPENTTEIDVIIAFNQGLYKLNANTGDRISRTAVIEIMYKEDGGTWQKISNANALYIRDVDGVKHPLSSSTTTVSGNKVTMHSPNNLNLADQLFFRTIGFEVPSGKYSVRVRSADYKAKSNYDIGYPNCSEIQFRCSGNVVNPDILPKVNQISFEATAYKGLSGTLQKFNYIGEAIIPIWNGTDWNTKEKTSNPASIIRYLLTDTLVNPRAESLDHIDNDSLVDYYNWCEEQGYKADGVVAEACKIGDIINEILKNTQTAMIPLYNGKHTFVIDNKNKIPIGMFNQHNSWDFNWMPNCGRQTEAIRASFVENDDYTQDELTLYWYDNAVHSEIKDGTTDLDYELVKKDYKYVQDRASVEKIVAYELEQVQTKRNIFEFTVNLEAMNMMLLDRVYISNSVNMQKEQTGLIKSLLIDNGYLKGFEFEASLEIPENATIVVRSLDYGEKRTVINSFSIINDGYTNIAYIEPVLYDGIIKGCGNIKGIQDVWYYDGDLFTLGQDTIYDCVITDIQYNNDGTATIKARDY